MFQEKENKESLELIENRKFMLSYKKSKEQIKNRDFDVWQPKDLNT